MSTNPHIVTTVKCAGPGCEHVRQECNHWFIVNTYVSGVGVFCCFPLKPQREFEPEDQPVCGNACAQKLFEQWMACQSEQSK